jgi:hypothetical protein
VSGPVAPPSAPPRTARLGLATAAAATAGAVLTVAVAQPARVVPGIAGPVRVVVFVGAAWLVFAAGAWLVRRLPVRTATILILLGGAVLPLAAATAPPRSSDDMYRYLWDGRVQAAGIDPYRYVPAAPELAPLRDDFLWPPTAPTAWCVPPGAVDPDHGRPLTPGCTHVNRPTVHTIYPPVAQALFLAVAAVSPPGGRELPLQLVMAGFALATTVLLLVGLRAARVDPRAAVLWAWCPTVALEAGNNAHADVVAAFLTGLALLALARAGGRRTGVLGGALLGLAVATKLTPLLVAPAVLRRRPVLVAAAATTAVAAVYLPHVLAVGTRVIGYIPGYLTEEGYTSGTRFALLQLILPTAWAAPTAVVVLAVVALRTIRGTDPDRPWLAATTMTGTALLVTTPSYPWYALLLVVLVALSGRVEWLAVAAAAYLAQYAHNVHLGVGPAQRIGYGLALAVVVTAALRRGTWWRVTPRAARSTECQRCRHRGSPDEPREVTMGHEHRT